jgi:hypothetical protein
MISKINWSRRLSTWRHPPYTSSVPSDSFRKDMLSMFSHKPFLFQVCVSVLGIFALWVLFGVCNNWPDFIFG